VEIFPNILRSRHLGLFEAELPRPRGEPITSEIREFKQLRWARTTLGSAWTS